MDHGKGQDGMSIEVALDHPEGGRGTTHWQVRKYDAEQALWTSRRLNGVVALTDSHFAQVGVKPYAVSGTLGNVITNAGWQALLASATTGGTPMFTASKGRIGVGDGTTAPAATDTDLSASSNRLFKFMAAPPVVSTGTNRTWTFSVSFLSGDANFPWQEFGIDQGTTDGTSVVPVFFNHALSNQGTKTTGQVWTATATVSFT